MVPLQEATPPHSPTHVASPISQENSSEMPRKLKSIQDFYNKTEKITNFEINDLFCLLLDSELMNFDETIKDARWRQAMEEKIKSIENNNT